MSANPQQLHQQAERGEATLLARAVTVLGLTALVFAVLRVASAEFFEGGLVAVVVAGTSELYRFAPSATRGHQMAGLFAAAAIATSIAFLPTATVVAVVPAVAMVLFSAMVLAARRIARDELHDMLFVGFGALYLSSTLGQLSMIRNLSGGRELTTVVLAIVLAREVTAHVAGRMLSGGTPLNSRINAKKTFEGAALGALGATAVAVVTTQLLSAPLTPWRAAVLGLVVGAACQAGDLVESYLKRVAGQRHSSGLLGAEGGILDFVDAAAFAAATAHPLLLWWRL
jgi:phosphatidate cytidylyltransferase